MRFQNVCLEAIQALIPEQIVTTDEIEHRLTPVYERLRLPAGRLELMTGIRERRVWPAGMLPSTKSAECVNRAIEAAGLPRSLIGALIHGSVCRDFLEPATASRVHHLAKLPSDCLMYDVSNACLGLMNGVVQIASLIELGQIRAGVVVGTESAGPLLESTIAELNRNPNLNRENIKRAVASLTIGSASAAIVLTHRSLSRTGNRLLGTTWRAASDFHDLCHSDRDDTIGQGMQPLMDTDSEKLMHEGIRAGAETFAAFLDDLGWTADDVDKSITHQVGVAHRRLMLERLGLRPNGDYPTVEWLGNTGSVALPVTLALAAEAGHLQSGDRVAMLGIGSGINVLMAGVDWQTTPQSVTSSPAVVIPQTTSP